LKTKLLESREMAFLSQKLVTIVDELPMKVELDDLKRKDLDRQQVTSLLNELEFQTFERKLFNSPATAESSANLMPASAESPAATLSMSDSSSSNVIDLSPKKEVIDLTQKVLTDHDASENEPRPAVLDISIEDLKKSITDESTQVTAVLDENGVFLRIGTKDYKLTNKLLLDTVSTKKKVDHNQASLFDSDYFYSEPDVNWSWIGFDLKEIWKQLNLKNPKAHFDLRVAAYVILSENVESVSELLEKLSKNSQHLNLSPATLTELARLQIKSSKPDATAQDSLDLISAVSGLLQSIVKNTEEETVLSGIDTPLIKVIFEMEKKGISLDASILEKQSHSLEKDLAELEQSIQESAGEKFLVSSPKQLSQILFEKLKLPTGKKTKTGFSTDSDVLEKLKSQHPICDLILKYRELAKLKSTYVDALPLLINKRTKRIHSHFYQTVTSTGRLSSADPNLQNIPIRTPRGSAVRSAFVARPGNVLVSADYSQIELRVLAHITTDPGLLRAFELDLDVHAMTASEVFGVPLNEVNSDLRRVAKEVNFGLAYGMGAFGLAENLGIARSEAQDIVKRYFTKFPKIQDFMSTTIEEAKLKGYTKTIWGRKRYLPQLASSNAMIRKFGERAAINAPIQGTAADVVKKAMLLVHANAAGKYDLLLQVHDELVVECELNQSEAVMNSLKTEMSSAAQLKVPLKVNVASGFNWEIAHG
jgi:DNA polymerase-1